MIHAMNNSFPFFDSFVLIMPKKKLICQLCLPHLKRSGVTPYATWVSQVTGARGIPLDPFFI